MKDATVLHYKDISIKCLWSFSHWRLNIRFCFPPLFPYETIHLTSASLTGASWELKFSGFTPWNTGFIVSYFRSGLIKNWFHTAAYIFMKTFILHVTSQLPAVKGGGILSDINIFILWICNARCIGFSVQVEALSLVFGWEVNAASKTCKRWNWSLFVLCTLTGCHLKDEFTQKWKSSHDLLSSHWCCRRFSGAD